MQLSTLSSHFAQLTAQCRLFVIHVCNAGRLRYYNGEIHERMNLLHPTYWKFFRTVQEILTPEVGCGPLQSSMSWPSPKLHAAPGVGLLVVSS